MDLICHLCKYVDESVKHIFNECMMSCWMLRKVVEASRSIINVSGIIDFDSFMADSLQYHHFRQFGAFYGH